MKTVERERRTRLILSLLLILMLAVSSVPVFAATEYYATWEEYTAANDLGGGYTYNQVVDGMDAALTAAAETYKGGDAEAAQEMITAVKTSYWGGSGFKIAMQKNLPAIHKSTVLEDFKTLGKVVKDGGTADDFVTARDVLIADLRGAANKLDGVKSDVEIAHEDETAATELFKEKYYGTWEEYSKTAGLETGWTWNNVADAMAEVFRAAKAEYEAGNADVAYDHVNDGYYGYYETTGFERNTMGYISGARKSEVELQFSSAKSAAKSGASKEEFNEAVDILRTMIRQDANRLDGVDEGGNSTGGGRSAAVATFIACFGILLREGFEAILVVGAIIAYLTKTTQKSEEERKKQLRPVYIGAVLGIILSFVSAWLLNLLKLANSASQEVIEGVTALLATAVLFYVSNWMVSKSESEAWDAYIKSKVGDAAKKNSSFALAFIAFLAVYREGAEVVLFYQPLISGDNMAMVWAGFAAGAAALVVVYLVITKMSVRLPLKPFFLATSILMAIMSISFLGGGIKELIEGDVIQMHSPAWVSWIPSNAVLEVLGIYPCVETIVPQLILTAITIATFIFWMKRNKKLKEQMTDENN